MGQLPVNAGCGIWLDATDLLGSIMSGPRSMKFNCELKTTKGIMSSAEQRVRTIIESAIFVAENEGQICPDEYDLVQAWIRLSVPEKDDTAADMADACHTLLEAGFRLIPNEVQL